MKRGSTKPSGFAFAFRVRFQGQILKFRVLESGLPGSVVRVAFALGVAGTQLGPQRTTSALGFRGHNTKFFLTASQVL